MTDQELAALVEAHGKMTAGEWEVDEVNNEGDYGSGPDCSTGFKSYEVGAPGPDGEWIGLFDTLNSGAASVEEDYDEYGGNAWDAVGKANLDGIVALKNAFPALVARLQAAEAENARLKMALHFYADYHKMPNDGPWGVRSDDFGDVARAALQEKPHG